MMGSSSTIKIFLATSAVASPKLVVLSVLIYLGSSQTLHRHRFPKWALSGIDGDNAARQDGAKNARFPCAPTEGLPERSRQKHQEDRAYLVLPDCAVWIPTLLVFN